MTSTQLFCENGDPIYQPLLRQGISYREPWSRSTRTGWFRGTNEIDRTEVAALLGCETRDVIQWENATDLEVEGESRADFGGY